MKLTAENVQAVTLDSMYDEKEHPGLTAETLPVDAIKSEGVMNTMVFDPSRLEKHREEIRDMLSQLPDQFMAAGGGGWSLMNMVVDKEGTLWGEQYQADTLFQLGQAVGLCKYCMPRGMWSILPGSMPYIVVDLSEKKADSEAVN